MNILIMKPLKIEHLNASAPDIHLNAYTTDVHLNGHYS